MGGFPMNQEPKTRLGIEDERKGLNRRDFLFRTAGSLVGVSLAVATSGCGFEDDDEDDEDDD
jgi:hypothetical protein